MHIITTYETQNEETDIHHIHSPMQMQKNTFPKFNAAPLDLIHPTPAATKHDLPFVV